MFFIFGGGETMCEVYTPEFKRIAVGVDGSAYSFKALEVACRMAKLFNTEIVQAIHVVPTRLPYAASSALPEAHYLDFLREMGKEALNCAERIASKHEVSLEKVLLEGDPVEELAKHVQESRVDLLVLGRRGLGKESQPGVGSVSLAVASNVECSLLIVH